MPRYVPPPPQTPHRGPAKPVDAGSALALSCAGICCFFLAIAGVIQGYRAYRYIEQSGGLAPGKGQAVAAMAVGGIILAFTALYMVASLASGSA